MQPQKDTKQKPQCKREAAYLSVLKLEINMKYKPGRECSWVLFVTMPLLLIPLSAYQTAQSDALPFFFFFFLVLLKRQFRGGKALGLNQTDKW